MNITKQQLRIAYNPKHKYFKPWEVWCEQGYCIPDSGDPQYALDYYGEHSFVVDAFATKQGAQNLISMLGDSTVIKNAN